MNIFVCVSVSPREGFLGADTGKWRSGYNGVHIAGLLDVDKLLSKADQ